MVNHQLVNQQLLQSSPNVTSTASYVFPESKVVKLSEHSWSKSSVACPRNNLLSVIPWTQDLIRYEVQRALNNYLWPTFDVVQDHRVACSSVSLIHVETHGKKSLLNLSWTFPHLDCYQTSSTAENLSWRVHVQEVLEVHLPCSLSLCRLMVN